MDVKELKEKLKGLLFELYADSLTNNKLDPDEPNNYWLMDLSIGDIMEMIDAIQEGKIEEYRRTILGDEEDMLKNYRGYD